MTTPISFAPYSEPPAGKSKLPQSSAPIASTSTGAPSSQNSYQGGAPISSLGPQTSFAGPNNYSNASSWISGGDTGVESTLGRYDLEASAAYALGPFGAALLLVLEFENDYVRFHAWQSAMLSVSLFLLHLLFLPFSGAMEYLILLFDVSIFGYMSLRAYRDSDLLDRYHLPYIGEIAQRWVAEE